MWECGDLLTFGVFDDPVRLRVRQRCVAPTLGRVHTPDSAASLPLATASLSAR
jgi:hypothetical protein